MLAGTHSLGVRAPRHTPQGCLVSEISGCHSLAHPTEPSGPADAFRIVCRFASMIGTREHAEFMWRMTKDDNQHSKITQEPVMG